MRPSQFTDGSRWNTAQKYNDVTFAVRCEESHLATRMRYYVGDVNDDQSLESIDYTIPYEHLLWRKAPVMHEDWVEEESQPYVNIEAVESSPPLPVRQPSPVHVT